MKILHMGLSKATVEALGERSIMARVMEPLGIEEVPDWIESDEYDAVVVVIDECKFGNILPEFLRVKKIDIPLIAVVPMYSHQNWSLTRADLLERGCDDVVMAPENERELAASLRVIERRNNGQASEVVTVMYGTVPIVIDLVRGEVTVDGTRMRLTAHQLKVLTYLATHRGRVVTRSELSDYVYLHRGERVQLTNTIEVFVSIIRRKMRAIAEGSDSVLATKKGIGYLFDSVPEASVAAA